MMYVHSKYNEMTKNDKLNYYIRNRMVKSGDRIRTFAVKINSETDTKYRVTFFYMSTSSNEWQYKDRLFGKKVMDDAIKMGHIIPSDDILQTKLLLLGKRKEKVKKEYSDITLLPKKGFIDNKNNREYQIGDTFRIDNDSYYDIDNYTHAVLLNVTDKSITYHVNGRKQTKRISSIGWKITFNGKDFQSEDDDYKLFTKNEEKWNEYQMFEMMSR